MDQIAAGDAAGAQSAILDKLKVSVGGAAVAASATSDTIRAEVVAWKRVRSEPSPPPVHGASPR